MKDFKTVLTDIGAKVAASDAERQALRDELHVVRVEVDRLLSQLGGDMTPGTRTPTADAASITWLPATSRKGKGGRPKGYVMSDATKAKLRAAWKRRKAAGKSR